MHTYIVHCKTLLLSLFLLIAAICPTVTGNAQPLPGVENLTRSHLLDVAMRYLGVRYRLGGHTPCGFDCSGLVYYVFRESGISVPRTATAQYTAGRRVSRDRLKPGDLVFFSRRLSRPVVQHVGIYAGDDRFIHAPSFGLRVSFASMNDRYWRARYMGAVTFCVAHEELRERAPGAVTAAH